MLMRTPPFASWLPMAAAIFGPITLLCVAAAYLSAAAVEQNGPVPSSAIVRLADGFDFPVGWPEAAGYYKARGFRANGHLGEDWNRQGAGSSDLGDPIHSVANGLVLLARDVRHGWGNVVIVRHGYRDPEEGNTVKVVDSLYGHLDQVLVQEGQAVTRGQQIGTMGDNHGMYTSHLHFEVRKNLAIGMNRSAFARDFTNYHDPTSFLAARRQLPASRGTGAIAINTFVPYGNGEMLPPSDGAYELGVVRGPGVITRPLPGKSAYELQLQRGRATGNKAFDKLNEQFRVDRYGDIKK